MFSILFPLNVLRNIILNYYWNFIAAKYYRPHAILRNRSHLEDLISISCGQENTLFAIHLDYICFRYHFPASQFPQLLYKRLAKF